MKIKKLFDWDVVNDILSNRRKWTEILARYHCYPNEIILGYKAFTEIMTNVLQCLMFSPMQSGKTGSVKACAILMCKAIPGIKCVLICANDQVALRLQSKYRLEPYCKVLSLSDRRRLIRQMPNEPLCIFFDENHFGDGAGMTIDQFLISYGESLRQAIFIGVSATPFSSFMLPTVQNDIDFLERQGYCSVRTLLAQGRIRESRPLVVRDEVQENNPIYDQIDELLDCDYPSGTGIIRLTNAHMVLVKQYMQERYGDDVYMVEWNQKNPMQVNDFLANPRVGQFTILFVNMMARMGTTIDTKNVSFLHENVARSSKADTILQSFIGRACGFGKGDHSAVVYSSIDIADAYATLLEGDRSAFCNKLHRISRSPSARAGIVYKRRYDVEEEIFEYDEGTAIEDIIEDVREWAILRYDITDIRRSVLSDNKKRTVEQKPKRYHPSTKTAVMGLQNKPGAALIAVFDRYSYKREKDWDGIIVHFSVRVKDSRIEMDLEPSDQSIYNYVELTD